MRPIVSGELAQLQAAAEASMMCTCQRGVYTEGSEDDYGSPQITWVFGASSVCGFDAKRSREVLSEGEVVVTDGELRMPIATTIDSRDHFKITHRYGAELATQPVYEVIGLPMRGPSGLVLNLKLWTES